MEYQYPYSNPDTPDTPDTPHAPAAADSRKGSGNRLGGVEVVLLVAGNLLYLAAAIPALFMFLIATEYSEAVIGPVWLLLYSGLAWPVALVVSWVLFVWFHRKGSGRLGSVLFLVVFALWALVSFGNDTW